MDSVYQLPVRSLPSRDPLGHLCGKASRRPPLPGVWVLGDADAHLEGVFVTKEQILEFQKHGPGMLGPGEHEELGRLALMGLWAEKLMSIHANGIFDDSQNPVPWPAEDF